MQALISVILSFILSTNCTQDFTFMGVTGGQTAVFWIIEDVGGECYHSELVQVFVDKSSASEYRMSFAKYQQTDLFKKAFNNLQAETQVKLTGNQDSLSFSDEGWSVIKPPKNDSLLTKYYALEGRAEQWNLQFGERGMSFPTFHNCSASFIWGYDRGLYANYSVKQAYFIPTHRLLILFTDQPSRAPGSDTMDGFLIFRIAK